MTTTPADTVTGRAPRTVDRLLPFVAALPVLVLGGLRAGDQAFWMDEGASRHIATLPFVDMLRRLWRDEAGMGPYYLALWVWRHLFDSEAGLRWLSVIGGAVAVALIVWLAVGWFGRNAAIVTALVMVMNPFFLRHLTEARAYTWTMAVSVGFTIAFAALIERPTVWRVAVTASLAGLGIALHTVFVLWIAAAFLAAVAVGRVGRRHVVPLAAGTVLMAIVVAPFVPVMFRRSGQIDWIEPTTVRKIGSVAALSLGGTTLAIVLGIGVVAFLVSVAFGRGTGRPGTMLHVALVAAAAPGGALLLVVASFAKPLLIQRYLAPGFPFACLGAVLGWRWIAATTQTRWPDVRALRGVLAVPVVVSAIVFVARGPLSDEPRAEDPRAAVAHIAERFEPGDLIIVDRIGQLVVLQYLDAAGLDGVLAWDLDDGRVDVAPTATIHVVAWTRGDGDTPLADETLALIGDRPVERTEFGRAVVVTAAP